MNVFFNFKVRVYGEETVRDVNAYNRVPGREITLSHQLIKGFRMLADSFINAAQCNSSQKTFPKCFWGRQEQGKIFQTDICLQGAGYFCSLNSTPNCIRGLRVF